jgi:hypothetical protein
MTNGQQIGRQLPIANSLLRYAESTGAVLVTCSNLYGYGPGNETMTETLPLAATGTKGKVRAQMWHDARKLSETGRIRATEVRASDFICKGMGSRFGDRVVPSVLTGKEVQMLGKLDALHSWSYPPYVARLMMVIGLTMGAARRKVRESPTLYPRPMSPRARGTFPHSQTGSTIPNRDTIARLAKGFAGSQLCNQDGGINT